jgi:hypothetical protein
MGIMTVDPLAPALSLGARRDGQPPEARGGRLILRGEWEWLLRGPATALDPIAAALGRLAERLAPELLLLDFGNAVGHFRLPGLPPLEVVSGKWDERHFAQMLDELTAIAAGLPFAARETAGLPYDRSVADQPDVLYHLFVYVRHVLSDAPPPDGRLLPALRLILREPHQRFAQTRRVVPAELARGLDPAGFVALASGAGGFVRAGSGAAAHLPLARMLRGHLPARVDEPHAAITRDTPENRFIKAFLDQATGIVARMRRTVSAERPSPFRDGLLHDCDRLEAALRPVAEHPLWDEVGRMVHLPAGSPVLQRRRGYRAVYGHFGRLRLATRLPLTDAALRDLLAAKDIAHLYELWCFYTLVATITSILGAPVAAERPRADDFQVGVAWDLAVTWAGGARLLYNPRFSRSRPAERRSYSVPLRPDMALVVTSGPNAGLHLFDAKFRLDRLAATFTDAEQDDDDETTRMEERRGTFKRADLYKMHTYRDAIHDTRSVWILYPGTESHYFPDEQLATGGEQVARPLSGVGALPLAPDETGDGALARILGTLLGHGIM